MEWLDDLLVENERQNREFRLENERRAAAGEPLQFRGGTLPSPAGAVRAGVVSAVPKIADAAKNQWDWLNGLVRGSQGAPKKAPGTDFVMKPGTDLATIPKPGTGLATTPGTGLATTPGTGLATTPGTGFTMSPGSAIARLPGPGKGLSTIPKQPGTGTGPGAAAARATAEAAPSTSASAGGPPGLSEIFKALGGKFSGGANGNMNLRQIGLAIADSIRSNQANSEELPEAEIRLPEEIGGPQPMGSGGGGGSSSINAILAALGSRDTGKVGLDYQTLPQIDYTSLTTPDREALQTALESTRPEEPGERSFMQDLPNWLIPAVAGGLLGGIPGVLLGGMYGEGNRQDNEDVRQSRYEDESNEFTQQLAKNNYGMDVDERARQLEEMTGVRNQAAENYGFKREQENNAREDVNFMDQRRQQQLNEMLSALGIQEKQQTNDFRQAAMGGMMNAPVDDSLVFEQAMTSNPALYGALASQPAFESWQAAMQTGDELKAKVEMANMMQALRADPRMAPLLERIESNIRRQQQFQQLQ